MSRPFEVTREVDLPAAPDDVWTAITSETAAWQFPVGPPLTGAGGPVQTFEPPHRLVVRMESPDGTFNALDFTVEARDGGTAHLRYVHSGILAEEWADQYDAIGPHTDFYLHTLGEYLEHFRGRPVTYVGQPSSGIEGPAAAGEADAMDTLRAALGLGTDATAGGPVHRREWPARRRPGSRLGRVPRGADGRRPLPLLRSQPLRRGRRHERPPVHAERGRHHPRGTAAGVAGRGLRLKPAEPRRARPRGAARRPPDLL